MRSNVSVSNNPLRTKFYKHILTFRNRFGEAHFYFLCHASLSLSTSSKLLHALRANFQTYTSGDRFDVPWEAVSDILLSNIFQRVRHELYEIDSYDRNFLISSLLTNTRFGRQRIEEVSKFLISFFQEELRSIDSDISDTAQIQCFAALSLVDSAESIRQVAEFLSSIALSSPSEVCRFALVIEALEETWLGCSSSQEAQKLISYAYGLAALAHNRNNEAERILQKLFEESYQSDYLEIFDVKLLFPNTIRKTRRNYNKLQEVSSDRGTLDSDFDFIAFSPPLQAQIREVINPGEKFEVKITSMFDSLFNSIRYSGLSRATSYPLGSRYDFAVGEIVLVIGRSDNFFLVAPNDINVAIDRASLSSEGENKGNIRRKEKANNLIRRFTAERRKRKSDWREIKFVKLKGVAKVTEEISFGSRGRVDFEHGLWAAKLYLEKTESSLQSKPELVVPPGSAVEVIGRMGIVLYVNPLGIDWSSEMIDVGSTYTRR